MGEELRAQVLERLRTIIDPETGVDVVRMRLIEDLAVDEEGIVRYKFRPSSPFCPLAVPLALSIRKAVGQVEGVTRQQIEVIGYIKAGELNTMLENSEKTGSERRGG